MTVYATYDPTSMVVASTDLIARNITILSGATVNTVTPLPRGTVLGRITASDKYIPSVTSAVDGSQNPVAILTDTTDPSLGDVIAPAYFEGEFSDVRLTFDVSWTGATLEAAFRKANNQIFIRSLNTLG